ncbi:hypothetical protein ACLBXB_26430 [Methylobacterium mesophilicum]
MGDDPEVRAARSNVWRANPDPANRHRDEYGREMRAIRQGGRYERCETAHAEDRDSQAVGIGRREFDAFVLDKLVARFLVQFRHQPGPPAGPNVSPA